MEKFNTKQKLVVVGSSSDEALVDAVNYWRSMGLDIDFIPYRFYKIGTDVYFEFFAKPYDYHINAKDTKGIVFDTNKSYDEKAIWDMFANHKVSAYGKVAKCVNSFNKGDYVLYYHKGFGIVAVGIVKSAKAKENKEKAELYLEVELLTPVVNKESELRCISASELCELLDKNFWFAKTTKTPYLSSNEAMKVMEALKKKYSAT